MHAFLDKKFINLVSGQLERFKWQRPTLANCRCPLCGDSQKNKNKCRGYFYERDARYYYKCHNCGASTTVSGFLEKVNPALGCLPMLLQMPFFLAFYWVLIETVELRYAPFMIWITDLSSRDPLFILPILNIGAMWAMQMLQPQPAGIDPMQAKIFKFMPLIFGVMFAFFPAGLVLYWLINSLVSAIQMLMHSPRSA